jgi:hypothetical protein
LPDWTIYYRKLAEKYTLHRFISREAYENSIQHVLRAGEAPALHWLRLLGFLPWPQMSVEKIQNYAAIDTLLQEREKEVSHILL